MRIPAYCSFSFIQEITNRSVIDYIEPGKLRSGRAHFDLLELLAEGLQIKTDASVKKIEESLANPYIKYLYKNMRIEPEENDFKCLRSNCDDYFKRDKKNIGVYFLSENYKSVLSEYEQKSGYHFLSQSTDSSFLFEEDIESFQKSLNKSWKFTIRILNPHHSMVIAAPYLFSEKSTKATKKLIANVAPGKLKGSYHLTLIGSDNRKGFSLSNTQIVHALSEIKNELKKIVNDFVVEYHICNSEEFHDRIIVTNNTFLSLGYELDIIKNEEDVQKEGTWLASKPFRRVNFNGNKGALFYKVFLEKLSVLRKRISKSTNPNSSNPLFDLAE
jgi:hypothetical protein